MTTPADRMAALSRWTALADDALLHAADAGRDPGAAFFALAENTQRAPLPRSGATRCRALCRLAELYAQCGDPVERAAMAPALGMLAQACLELTQAARGQAAEPRKDIFG